MVGTADAGMAIEYVRGRKLLRVRGWAYGEPIDSLEVPVVELCARLGIDAVDLIAPHQYLLFAGSRHRPRGGLRDLVGSYESEDAAWGAFRRLRQGHPSGEGWGELAAMDGFGQVRQLAWFGLREAGERPGEGPPSDGSADRPLRTDSRGNGPAPVAYLRAVTPS